MEINTENIIGLFEKYNGLFNRFEGISNPPYRSRKLCAMVKLYNLCDDSFEIYTSYEKIAINNFKDLKDDLSEGDAIYLIKCGVWIDGESFCIFT